MSFGEAAGVPSLNLRSPWASAMRWSQEPRIHPPATKFIQVPSNVMMPEAFVEQRQSYEDADKVTKNKLLFSVATELGINVVTSQSLCQGLTANIPISKIAIPGLHNLSARHLQLMRSVPSESMLSSLVGMKHPDHVHANLETIKRPPMNK